MYIVMLEDRTTYNVDTTNEFQARRVVEYKLKDRLDYRKISTVQKIEGAICDPSSKYYNSDNEYDGKELHCVSGWSYKWD